MMVLIALGIYLLIGLVFSGILTDWYVLDVKWSWLSVISVMWPLFAVILIKIWFEELRSKWNRTKSG
jgi:ABC-type bacteriocin/lantibiotic exporter with double-glycine peptidase domain